MTDAAADETHVTLGRQFRTPAHPDVLAALGRALFCFLSLEETVTAILTDAGAVPLPMTRAKMAGAKETALQDLADDYRAFPKGIEIADALDAAVTAFRHARQSMRNELLHAHPFTAGTDSHGHYLPGLAYTAKDGKSWKTVSRSPEDLLDLAAAIEGALDPLNSARALVQSTPLSVP
ncbi:hypothetical protein [Nocardioides sp. AX2bis]|uniref:hypothetical protein n=1 Tax=Nocardioides sp. AX2bis TaxID=2653157 RepID=UPI0012F44E84|nr:hypothetical protein [Nocardioides sp. AX2bis]VXC36931.1 conserved hypothetical protein [Nocardioides sp. AX2bis]